MSFDDAIRGVQAHASGNAAASEQQLAAARETGLPDRLAHRLRGDDLTADARELRTVFDAGRPASMDDLIRRSVGKAA